MHMANEQCLNIDSEIMFMSSNHKQINIQETPTSPEHVTTNEETRQSSGFRSVRKYPFQARKFTSGLMRKCK